MQALFHVVDVVGLFLCIDKNLLSDGMEVEALGILVSLCVDGDGCGPGDLVRGDEGRG